MEALELARSYLARAREHLERGEHDVAAVYARSAAYAALAPLASELGHAHGGYSLSDLLDAVASRLGLPSDVRVDVEVLDTGYAEVCDCSGYLPEEPELDPESVERAVKAVERLLELVERALNRGDRGSMHSR